MRRSETLEQICRDHERELWILRMCVAIFVSLGVGMAIPHLRAYYFKRWMEAEERRLRIRRELNNCIKEYDVHHPDGAKEQEND